MKRRGDIGHAMRGQLFCFLGIGDRRVMHDQQFPPGSHGGLFRHVADELCWTPVGGLTHHLKMSITVLGQQKFLQAAAATYAIDNHYSRGDEIEWRVSIVFLGYDMIRRNG